MFPAPLADKLRGSTVVLSCPCGGNLGAMSMDCLLATLSQRGKLERIGSGVSKHLLPMTGYESFPNGAGGAFMIMPIEVYAATGTEKLFFIQIRSDCQAKESKQLSLELVQALLDVGVGHAILMTGFGEDDVLDEYQAFR
jgi:hypothetical protein